MTKREAIYRRALETIARLAAVEGKRVAASETPHATDFDFDPVACAKHALKTVDALPTKLPCGCLVHISNVLEISVVTPCAYHQTHPRRRRAKKGRRHA